MGIVNLNWTESEGVNPLMLFDNFLLGATVVTSPSSPGVVDALTQSTYDAWTFNTPQTVTFDLGSAKEYSALGIVGHNLSQQEVSVQLFSSVDNSTFLPINATAHLITDKDTLLFVFNKRETRYFRIVFISGTSTGTFIRSLILGFPLEMPGGIAYGYTPIWLSQERELLVSKTMNGQFIGNRVVSKGAMTDIPLLSVERGFIEDDLQPFMEHYNEGKPFIFAGGPSIFNKDVAYVWRQDGAEMRPTFDQSGNWMSLTMSVEGYVQ